MNFFIEISGSNQRLPERCEINLKILNNIIWCWQWCKTYRLFVLKPPVRYINATFIAFNLRKTWGSVEQQSAAKASVIKLSSCLSVRLSHLSSLCCVCCQSSFMILLPFVVEKIPTFTFLSVARKVNQKQFVCWTQRLRPALTSAIKGKCLKPPLHLCPDVDFRK